MKENVMKDILSGMFIVSTNNSACVVDTVLQVSSSNQPLISVTINKNNYTNKMLKKNKKFAISILSEKVNGNIIKTFGFNSSRDIDKFKDFDYIEVDGIKILKDTIGYMILELTSIVDTETHDIFIGRIIENQRFNTEKPMSYQYYQEHKEGLLEIKTKNGKTAWVCTVCGFVYYGDLPNDFVCPICGVGVSAFIKK